MSATLPPLDDVIGDATAESLAMSDPDADADADADHERVAFTHDGRELVGTVVAREPAPLFGSPDRERVTVRVDGTDETLQVLAADLHPSQDAL